MIVKMMLPFMTIALIFAPFVFGRSHQRMATISQMIWPDNPQTNNNHTSASIRLNVIGDNRTIADSFTTNDTNVLDALMINPQDIQFVVPNQPHNVGQQVVKQIQQQLGSQPISLAELKNKNMSFTLEMPGVQLNRTVETNISDETIVQRSSPRSFVVQSPPLANPTNNYNQQIYMTNSPPLMKPQSDYASYMIQTNGANYVNPGNQPTVIYRYIEVCNGQPYKRDHENIQQQRQIEAQQQLQDGYRKLSDAQTQMESGMNELQNLERMVQYYQNLLPQLNSYAQQTYPQSYPVPPPPPPPPPPPTPSPSSPYIRSYSASFYPNDNHNGNIRMSYHAVEETYKTDKLNDQMID